MVLVFTVVQSILRLHLWSQFQTLLNTASLFSTIFLTSSSVGLPTSMTFFSSSNRSTSRPNQSPAVQSALVTASANFGGLSSREHNLKTRKRADIANHMEDAKEGACSLLFKA